MKQKQIKVLMYHRIADGDTDPWGICVAPHHFEAHIRYLAGAYNLVTVEQTIAQLTAGAITEDGICITFDDGYADNYLHAKPILERHQCPAAFFIPTAFISSDEPFWWDELEYIFLHLPQLPATLSLVIDNAGHDYELRNSTITQSQWQQHKAWKWYDDPPTDRCAVFLWVWNLLRPLPLERIKEQIALLRAWAGSEAPHHLRPVMTSGQLKAHFGNALFSAHLHTHTHADLGAATAPAQRAEIEQGSKMLQAKYGFKSACLAYPYGRYNKETATAAQQLNLAACFTTEAMPVESGSPPFFLGRYQVGDWSLDEFKTALRL